MPLESQGIYHEGRNFRGKSKEAVKFIERGDFKMARENDRMLDTGDFFPEMEFDTVSGEKIVLPRDFGQRWNVLLFYWGHW